MGMKLNQSGDFPKAPEGLHQAVCYGVVDIGTHVNHKFGSKQHKCVLFFEFAKLRLEDGRPMVQSSIYTASLGDKSNLGKHLRSWKGRAMTPEEKESFDGSMLIGRNCMLQIIHNEDGDRVYANIENILPLIDGMESYVAQNDTLDYELTPGYIPEGMYDWVADKIRASEEWNAPPKIPSGELTDEQAAYLKGQQAPPEISDVEPF